MTHPFLVEYHRALVEAKDNIIRTAITNPHKLCRRVDPELKKEANKAPRTIQHTLAILRHIIYQAQKLGFFKGDNPAKGNSPIPDNKRLRFLTPQKHRLC